MATVITINRADVVALVEEAAAKLTDGNKTEAVALAVRRLLDQEARKGSLFGAHPGSVKVRKGVDLTAAVLADDVSRNRLPAERRQPNANASLHSTYAITHFK